MKKRMAQKVDRTTSHGSFGTLRQTGWSWNLTCTWRYFQLLTTEIQLLMARNSSIIKIN